MLLLKTDKNFKNVSNNVLKFWSQIFQKGERVWLSLPMLLKLKFLFRKFSIPFWKEKFSNLLSIVPNLPFYRFVTLKIRSFEKLLGNVKLWWFSSSTFCALHSQKLSKVEIVSTWKRCGHISIKRCYTVYLFLCKTSAFQHMKNFKSFPQHIQVFVVLTSLWHSAVAFHSSS